MVEATTISSLPAALAAPPEDLAREAWILEPPMPHEIPHVLRSEAGLLIDGLLVRAARGSGALDVAIAERLGELSVGDRTLRIGYSGIGDYAQGRLGIARRTGQQLARLGRAFGERPILREAVRRGEVSARKAEAVLAVAVGAAEAEWVARARTETVRALESAVDTTRPPSREEDEAWEQIEISLSPVARAKIDEAMALAGKVLGAASPRWQRLEAMCMEYLGAHPVEVVEDERSVGEPVTALLDGVKAGLEAEMRRWEWLEELNPTPRVEAPGGAEPPPVDPRALDAELRELVGMRERWDELVGHLAMLLQRLRLWKDMGFADFGHYVTERLQMGVRAVEQRAALARKLYSLPALRTAMREGKVTYEKARLVARVATADTAEAWIARAEKATCIALKREIEAKEEAQTCAARTLVIRAPERVGVLLADTFRAVREAEGKWISAEACLVRVAEHFIETHRDSVPERRTPGKRALERDHGWCQVPDCSRPAVHSHHIIYVSRGGSDDDPNRVSLCAAHHLHAVHKGWVRVKGEAPHRLTWTLGSPPIQVYEPEVLH